MNATVERAHAILSASGANRWMNCPPSALKEAALPDKDTQYTRAGTIAHSVAEIVLSHRLKHITKRTLNSRLKKLATNPDYDDEMITYAEAYADYVQERILSKDAVVLIEERLDFSEYVPDGFGTGDCVIIQNDTLIIVDYKYGIGVPVSDQDNPQMQLYALGANSMYGFIYDFDYVEMCIFQPRINNISSNTKHVMDLVDWGEEAVRPIAELAIKGEGVHKPGDHCGFCKLKPTCKYYADYLLETAKEDFEDLDGDLSIDFLSPEDYAMIIGRASMVKEWLTAVENYAIEHMLSGDLDVPGYKVVEGRSVRKIADQDKVIDTLTANGFDEAILFEKKLLSITNLEKLVKKKAFNELVGEYIEKPKGKPTLAPLSDKRSVYTDTDDFEIEN